MRKGDKVKLGYYVPDAAVSTQEPEVLIIAIKPT
jgi:hypothetical protein